MSLFTIALLGASLCSETSQSPCAASPACQVVTESACTPGTLRSCRPVACAVQPGVDPFGQGPGGYSNPCAGQSVQPAGGCQSGCQTSCECNGKCGSGNCSCPPGQCRCQKQQQMGWTNGVLGPYEDDDSCCCCCCRCFDKYVMQYCVGPGDLHPHYAYYPKFHGYYYFRPYNYQHVLYDAATVATMGGDPRAPYSAEFLKPIFGRAAAETFVPRVMPPQPFDDGLPLLEDLLDERSEAAPNYDGDMPPEPSGT